MNITSRTSLFLIVGHPIKSSISPQIYNCVFDHLAIDARYLALDILPERFGKIFPSLLDSGIRGNITAPFKEMAHSFVDIPSNEAILSGACNLFWSKDGIVRGDNTDIQGFLKGLPPRLRKKIPGSNAMVLGAGGAARSVAVGLLGEGIEKLLIVNRNMERADDLVKFLGNAFPRREIRCRGYDEIKSLSGESFRCLVNATSAGWKKREAPSIDPCEISGLEFYFDVIYRNRTSLMERCDSLGIEVAGGLEMLIQQAALSLERWFGIEPPIDLMRKSAEKALGGTSTG